MRKRLSFFRKKFLSPLREFIHDSRAVGITLLCCTVISLLLSNSALSNSFVGFWEKEIHLPFPFLHVPHTIAHWINDGLMAVFFLLVGMEIKRELITGELSSLQKSILPAMAAIGGMLVPALLYFGWNSRSGFGNGWGVPMATDIAFSLGILSLLGKRVPFSLKILLTALAIIDDLGAIVAIAIFYTDRIDWLYLALGGLIWVALFIMNRLKVRSLALYFIPGLLLWYCLYNSGIHATLAGVMLAFTLPVSKINKLEHKLHDPVNFIILPLFALANTAIVFPAEIWTALSSPINYGILSGLIIGKPLGITLVSYIAVKLKLAKLPDDLRWGHILGMGMLAGIGFTMSIFISMLAFSASSEQITAKLAVLIASLVAGLAGFIYLRLMHKKST
jgi:NhaA family Na+:H+ antiporter